MGGGLALLVAEEEGATRSRPALLAAESSKVASTLTKEDDREKVSTKGGSYPEARRQKGSPKISQEKTPRVERERRLSGKTRRGLSASRKKTQAEVAGTESGEGLLGKGRRIFRGDQNLEYARYMATLGKAWKKGLEQGLYPLGTDPVQDPRDKRERTSGEDHPQKKKSRRKNPRSEKGHRVGEFAKKRSGDHNE